MGEGGDDNEDVLGRGEVVQGDTDPPCIQEVGKEGGLDNDVPQRQGAERIYDDHELVF